MCRFTSMQMTHNIISSMKRLDACVEDIRQWMENNFLKLNDSKTELIIFGTPKNDGKVAECTVVVGDAIILPSGSVRNIGTMLNPTLNMETHIINMKRACYLQLRLLSKIRIYLTQEAAEKLTHAFVASRLDIISLLIKRERARVYIECASSRCLNAPTLCTDAYDLLRCSVTVRNLGERREPDILT